MVPNGKDGTAEVRGKVAPDDVRRLHIISIETQQPVGQLVGEAVRRFVTAQERRVAK
jgi:hypothetical protein